MNIFRRNKKQPKKEQPKKDAPESAGGFFSTDSALERKDWAYYILANAFRKTHRDIRPQGAGGTAMDSLTADSADFKNAYNISTATLPANLLAWYVSQGFIGFQACAIIAQHWLVDKACSIKAADAIRNGYTLTVNDGSDAGPEELARLTKLDKKYGVKRNLKEFDKFRHVFGIRVALFKVDSDDEDYYLKPFNIDGVKKGSYKGISQVDPYWITPELDDSATSDPSSMHFYEPTWWRINGKRYHRSHLIISRYTDVADILKPSYVYGGIPLPQLIYERVYSAERTANEGPQLAMSKRVNVVSTDIEKALANQHKFEERMGVFNQLRDNFGLFVKGKEEEFTQIDTSLADLDGVIMTQYQLVAAIAKVPATKLLGTSPKGFGASGEYESESYHDELENIQADVMTPLLDRHYLLLAKSEGINLSVDVVWRPVGSPSAKEVAEINEIDSRTDLNLINAGVIGGEEARDRIIANETSGYNGISPVDFADEPEGGEGEQIELA